MPDPSRREHHDDVPTLIHLVGVLPDVTPKLRLQAMIGGQPLDAIAAGVAWTDTDRLWDLILERGLRAPGFRMVNNGATLPRSAVSRSVAIGDRTLDDLIEPNRVLEHHRDGATMVVQGLQHLDATYGRLSNNLALELDQPIQVNAYLSPPAARGLDVHFDYHDVIVVQLSGTKRWRVWEPLPRTRRPVRYGPGLTMPDLAELGEPVIDRVIGPGDRLVIPRGHPHAVETVDDASVHLTLGIMAFTWERLIRFVLSSGVSSTALADRPGLDASLDDCVPDDPLEVLARHFSSGRLEQRIRSEVWRRQPRTRLRPRSPIEVGPDTLLRFTPGPLVWLNTSTDAARLHLGDRVVSMPSQAAPLLATLLSATNGFTARQITGSLDLDDAMVVINRLVVEGVLAHA